MSAFELLSFRLRFDPRGATFHHGHVPAVHGLLADRLGQHHLPDHCTPVAIESGRTRYDRGDAYHFGLVQRVDAGPDAATWRRLLAAPPRRTGLRGDEVPFSDNIVVDEVWDHVAERPVGAGRRGTAQPLGLRALTELADTIADQDTVSLRFLTPLLVYRTPVDARTHIFDEHLVDPAILLQRIARAVQQWAPEVAMPADARVALVHNGLLRADVRYGRGKAIAGSVGSVRLCFEGGVGAWALPLVVGGLAGIGKSTGRGMGHYVLDELPGPGTWPPRPARTILQHAAAPRVLDAALDALRDAGRAPGVDGETLHGFLDRADLEAGRIARSFDEGSWDPRPLRGLLARRPDGRFRPLTVPTFRDRLAQRAVLEVVRPALDHLFEASSFAYRAGLSRRDAQRSVRRAWDEGYRWVLDADIAAFFDEVDWSVLEHKLRALYGPDPVVDALMGWVRAPVWFDGQPVPRTRGLPQGAVVSPVLANLYLDAFDDQLARRGLRLIRYADDFLVVCRTREEAEAAQVAVVEELEHLRLRLRADKTAVTSFEQGFAFLGSLFCRSLVLDVAPAERGDADIVDSLDALRSDAAAWAAVTESSGWTAALRKDGPEVAPERRWRGAVAPPSPDRRVVYIVDGSARVVGRRQGLVVERDDQLPTLVAWSSVRMIVLVGGHRVSSSTYQHALRRKIPVAFHRRDGRPSGVLLPEGVRTPSVRMRQQWAWRDRGAAPLEVARALVRAKIHNVRLLARRQQQDLDDVVDRLAHLEDEARRCERLDRLRGLEGAAAHAWFAVWPRLLGPEWAWPGRSGRGAADPVNAMLNLLYAMLHRRAWMTLLSVDLDPFAAVLHAPTDRYPALASDMMEPYRFLVDRVVLQLVHQHRVGPMDFAFSEKGPYPCRMREATLKLVLRTWEEALHRQVTWEGHVGSYDQHLSRQCRALGELVDGERAEPLVLRMRW